MALPAWWARRIERGLQVQEVCRNCALVAEAANKRRGGLVPRLSFSFRVGIRTPLYGMGSSELREFLQVVLASPPLMRRLSRGLLVPFEVCFGFF